MSALGEHPSARTDRYFIHQTKYNIWSVVFSLQGLCSLFLAGLLRWHSWKVQKGYTSRVFDVSCAILPACIGQPHLFAYSAGVCNNTILTLRDEWLYKLRFNDGVLE